MTDDRQARLDEARAMVSELGLQATAEEVVRLLDAALEIALFPPRSACLVCEEPISSKHTLWFEAGDTVLFLCRSPFCMKTFQDLGVKHLLRTTPAEIDGLPTRMKRADHGADSVHSSGAKTPDL